MSTKTILITLVLLFTWPLTCAANVVHDSDSLGMNKIELLVAEIKSDKSNRVDSLLNKLLEAYEAQYTANSAQYAECLLWCANICVEKGDNEQGLNLIHKSNSLFERHGQGSFDGRDTLSQIFYLDLMSRLEDISERTFGATRYARNSLRLKQQYFGDGSEICLISLLDLSRIYAGRLSQGKSNYYHNLGYDAYVNRIKTEFCSTCESKRTVYWSTAAQYIHRTLSVAYKSSERASKGPIASAAYNAVLLSKGLLLNTTRSFEEHVNMSGNQCAIDVMRTRQLGVELQASQSVIDSLDYEILRVLKESGQEFQLPQLYIEWQDVASKLSADDLAIEFYRNHDGGYGAILLKKGWRSPRLVRLSNVVVVGRERLLLEDALKNVSLESYDDSRARDLWNLSKAIWVDDIVDNMPRTKEGRVYFAADGELLISAIEHFPYLPPNDDGSYYAISDIFPIYRLSSTRELAVERKANSGNQAAIYGGLRYDMYYHDVVADAHSKRNQRKRSIPSPSKSLLHLVRAADAGFDYLEGTRVEADSIVMTLRQIDSTKLHTTAYIGVRGTEASFKALSGRGVRLAHIATHGYFWGNDDATFGRLRFSDHPLNRCGLLLSGADNKWFGDELPRGVDDGFLTALEISALDFRGMDLIVLSACETGRGDVEGDGVFGLQRGFKMASANSILMSLWKVDDNATCRLMIDFYRNWIVEGMTKHDALERAKQTLRSYKDNGWDNPYYWASFILLDGIE